jgi:hypothetical protein
MTGNTLTQNPITGTNAYANPAYGTPQQGFWGNTGGFGTSALFGLNTPTLQQVPSLFNQIGAVTPPFAGQTFQQPGMVGQTVNPWQYGFTPTGQVGLQGITGQLGFQGIQNPIMQAGQVVNPLLQAVPPQVLNTILQTCPPQVLPYILNALAAQQACQQVLLQNPQAMQAINPLTITQPFVNTTQPFLNTTQPFQGQFGITGYGVSQTPFVGFQPQYQQGACVGCTPGVGQWGNTVGFQGGFGQIQPQQPWFATTYGTW